MEEARAAGLDAARFRIDLGSNAIVEAFGNDLEATRTIPDEARAAGACGQSRPTAERLPFPTIRVHPADDGGISPGCSGPSPTGPIATPRWRRSASPGGAPARRARRPRALWPSGRRGGSVGVRPGPARGRTRNCGGWRPRCGQGRGRCWPPTSGSTSSALAGAEGEALERRPGASGGCRRCAAPPPGPAQTPAPGHGLATRCPAGRRAPPRTSTSRSGASADSLSGTKRRSPIGALPRVRHRVVEPPGHDPPAAHVDADPPVAASGPRRRDRPGAATAAAHHGLGGPGGHAGLAPHHALAAPARPRPIHSRPPLRESPCIEGRLAAQGPSRR